VLPWVAVAYCSLQLTTHTNNAIMLINKKSAIATVFVRLSYKLKHYTAEIFRPDGREKTKTCYSATVDNTCRATAVLLVHKSLRWTHTHSMQLTMYNFLTNISVINCKSSLNRYTFHYVVPVILNTACSRKKWHKVCGTTFLQPYITESCGFQQNVQK